MMSTRSRTGVRRRGTDRAGGTVPDVHAGAHKHVDSLSVVLLRLPHLRRVLRAIAVGERTNGSKDERVGLDLLRGRAGDVDGAAHKIEGPIRKARGGEGAGREAEGGGGDRVGAGAQVRLMDLLQGVGRVEERARGPERRRGVDAHRFEGGSNGGVEQHGGAAGHADERRA